MTFALPSIPHTNQIINFSPGPKNILFHHPKPNIKLYHSPKTYPISLTGIKPGAIVAGANGVEMSPTCRTADLYTQCYARMYNFLILATSYIQFPVRLIG